MKKILAAVFSLAVISAYSQKTATVVSPDEFQKGSSATGVQLLDVRTSGEFNAGHLKNALWADWTDQPQFMDRIQYVDKNKPVYIYCLSGARSAAAATWMRQNGYENVIELQGGINAWKKENKPVEGASAEKQMTLDQYHLKIAAKGVVLVDFGATWCPPCVKMEPVLQDVISEKGNTIQFVRVDGGLHTDVMKELGIEALPVFIIYKNGKETWRGHGVVAKEELLKQLK
jgi:rhodanese-related sulfurtransferase